MTHKLSLLKTFFKDRLLHRYTWNSNNKRTKEVIDYVLAEKYVQQYKTECKVYLGFQAETDHRVLKATICAPINRTAKRSCRNPTPPKTKYSTKVPQKYDLLKNHLLKL